MTRNDGSDCTYDTISFDVETEWCQTLMDAELACDDLMESKRQSVISDIEMQNGIVLEETIEHKLLETRPDNDRGPHEFKFTQSGIIDYEICPEVTGGLLSLTESLGAETSSIAATDRKVIDKVDAEGIDPLEGKTNYTNAHAQTFNTLNSKFPVQEIPFSEFHHALVVIIHVPVFNTVGTHYYKKYIDVNVKAVSGEITVDELVPNKIPERVYIETRKIVNDSPEKLNKTIVSTMTYVEGLNIVFKNQVTNASSNAISLSINWKPGAFGGSAKTDTTHSITTTVSNQRTVNHQTTQSKSDTTKFDIPAHSVQTCKSTLTELRMLSKFHGKVVVDGTATLAYFNSVGLPQNRAACTTQVSLSQLLSVEERSIDIEGYIENASGTDISMELHTDPYVEADV